LLLEVLIMPPPVMTPYKRLVALPNRTLFWGATLILKS